MVFFNEAQWDFSIALPMEERKGKGRAEILEAFSSPLEPQNTIFMNSMVLEKPISWKREEAIVQNPQERKDEENTTLGNYSKRKD